MDGASKSIMRKKKGKKISGFSVNQQLKAIRQEIRPSPKVGPAPHDPPPVSVSKTLYINRVVRVASALTTGAASITVDEIKAQSSSAPFKVLAISAWVVGSRISAFSLGEAVWNDDTTTLMTYRDVAPITRLCGCRFNIPDIAASVLNTGTTVVVSCAAATPLETGAQLIADVTIRYQI